MTRPTRATIATDALRRNLAAIRSRLAPETRVMGVVKANCYGHGVEICVPVLEAEGIDIFGVATISEAEQLRRNGVASRIVLLTTPCEAEAESIVALDLEPFISDVESATWLAAAARRHARELRVHLYVDTGMTRNGCDPGDAGRIVAAMSEEESLVIQGIASHFATSEEDDHTYAVRQHSIFDGLLRELKDAGRTFEDVHIANSGGIFNHRASHHTLVRPGLSLYGYHPHPDLQASSGLAPVMSIRSIISSVRSIAKGSSISYGRRYTTSRDTRIATLPIGYGDGYPRLLTNRTSVLIGGVRYPVVGTICMDEIMVDLGPESRAVVGDEVILLGADGDERIDAWELASTIGTIPYEITTGIAHRVPRVRDEESASDIIDGAAETSGTDAPQTSMREAETTDETTRVHQRPTA